MRSLLQSTLKNFFQFFKKNFEKTPITTFTNSIAEIKMILNVG